jgi:hypothetical protein
MCFTPQPELAPDRDWLSEHLDRVDRTTWVCYVMAGTAAVARAAPLNEKMSPLNTANEPNSEPYPRQRNFVACSMRDHPADPFPANHPASPEAQEAPIAPSRNSLVSDEATKKSNDLLAAAERGTLHPAPGTIQRHVRHARHEHGRFT